MKLAAFIVLCVFVALSTADTIGHPRGCIYVLGRCIEECPVGTHAYTTGCGYKTPEATCAEPNPVPEMAMICDYSSCYCDSPTIRDESTGKCVLLENCSAKTPTPTPTLLPPYEDRAPSAPAASETASTSDTGAAAQSSSATKPNEPTAATEASAKDKKD